MNGILQLLTFLARRSRDLRGSRAMAVIVVLGGIVSGLCSAAFIALFNTALSHGGLRSAPELFKAFIALCLLLPISRFISGALLLRLAGRAVSEMRVRIARRILSAPLRRLEEVGSHRLVATLTNDINAIIEALILLPELIMQIFIVLGCLAYLAWLSWTAFLVVVGFMVVGILTYQLPIQYAMRYLERAREHSDSFYKGVEALTEGTKELKIHQLRRLAFFSRSYEPAARSIENEEVTGRSIMLGAASWGHVLFFLVIGLILLGLAGSSVVEPRIATGFSFVIILIMAPLTGIMNVIPMLLGASVAIQKIDRLGLSLEEASTEKELPPGTQLPAWQTIELSAVQHSYHSVDEGRSFDLGPLDLSLRPGELVFIIGGNGSGKTTLAKILCGLYPPESGAVLFNGEPVDDATREAYRQNFSVVFSDVYVFDSLLGLETRDLDERTKSYLRTLQIEKVVTVRDGALSTVNVSQGQRKRLALLTAYLEDRPIYVFDEWAADQDPQFKEIFYRHLLPELKGRGKTVIVISHDDRYYDAAERLIKLETGKITQHLDRGVPPLVRG